MNKEDFKKEWDKIVKLQMFDFPNGEYYYVSYNAETDRLEYGYVTNIGFHSHGGIEVDYDFSVNQNLEALMDKIVKEHPELLESNTEDWFDELNENELVAVWNKYVELGLSGSSDDKIYKLNEMTINVMFEDAWSFATKVCGPKWDDCHNWWWFNRCTGWAESIERLEDVVDISALSKWATSHEAWPILLGMANHDIIILN